MAAARSLAVLFSGGADRRLVAGFAGELGYTVETDWTAGRATPDMFLLDENAARRQGPEVLELKRASQTFLPVLVTVRSGDAIPAWLAAGFDDCLRAPLRKAELRARLEAFMRLREQAAQLVRRQELALSSSERRLREMAEQWQATFDAANDAFWIVDREQRVLRANRATTTLLGIEPEDLLGKHCWPLIHRSAAPVADCPFQRARASGRREALVLKAGDRRLRVVVDPILGADGSFDGAVHILSDVTQEELARERDALLAQAFGGLHRCAFLLREPGDDWMTAPLGEARRSLGLEFAWLHDARGEAAVTLVSGGEARGGRQRVFPDDGTPPACVEQSRKRTDAFVTEITGDCATCAAHGAAGQVCVAAPILRESVWVGALGGVMPARRAADPRLIEVLRILAHDVGAAMAAREAARDQERLREQLAATQRLESVGRLAGGVAHDFNNLLTVIDGSASLVEEELGPHDPARADVRAIRDAAASATKLTRQLLAFSRRQIIKPRRLDLNAVVADMQRMLGRIIGEDIDLRLALAEQGPVLEADPGQLEQVIVNLVANARDAMPTGGKITIETARAVLDEDYCRKNPACRAGEFALLAVSDTGCGMDQATLARIFEPFFSTKDKQRGTGLGLATVYGIVKQADGFIWAYSEPGRGATFKVYLPLATGAAEDLTSEAIDVSDLAGDETILLVEDHADVRSITARMLRDAGYCVLEADGLEQALGQLEPGRKIDLLLTDVVMPGGSGREVADAVCRLSPGARVLFMSGYTSDTIVHHGVLDPGVAFVSKPLARVPLLSKVREVLGAAPHRPEPEEADPPDPSRAPEGGGHLSPPRSRSRS